MALCGAEADREAHGALVQDRAPAATSRPGGACVRRATDGTCTIACDIRPEVGLYAHSPICWYEQVENHKAELAAAVAQNEQLRPVIAGLMRRRLPNGDPCWCSDAEVQAHYPAHGYWCSKARAALSSQTAAPVAGGKGNE